MIKSDNLLNNIKIASPCSADWNEMVGDERKRYCGECKLNVYNLSEMTKAQAENFILKSEDRVCVKIYKRADGTVLTKDCPVGWAKIINRTKIFATAAISLVLSLLTGLFFTTKLNKIFAEKFSISTATHERLTGVMSVNSNKTTQEKVIPLMGNVAVQPPKAALKNSKTSQ
jgi:hypothetical protein